MDQELFRTYYINYYKETLGLTDWELHVDNRIHECSTFHRIIQERIRLIQPHFPEHAKVLIVGGGTGAELVAFHKLGFEAWMLEPNETACTLARQVAEDNGIASKYVLTGVAESLPFADCSIDFIWCFTVLEHVNNYGQAITEMVRVLKVNAWAYLMFPDYRSIYESHYKTYLPLFLPKCISSFFLKLKGRNPKFFIKHTNHINAKKFLSIARKLPLETMCVETPWDDTWKNNRTWKMNIAYYMREQLGIGFSPSFYLRKL